MEQRIAAESVEPPSPAEGEPGAIDFVRFCYHRRRVGWPELYDEMCAVAGRGLYRGFNVDDLNGIGVGLTLFEMPTLAAIVQRVVAEDQERRRRTLHAFRVAHAERTEEPASAELPATAAPSGEVDAADAGPTEPQPRLVPAVAGA